MSHPDLFAFYPEAPGYKGTSDTARAAAAGIAGKVGTLRDRVLHELCVREGTPEQIAARMREPVMNIRPRLSELRAKGLVEDTGKRGTAMGGRLAIVWRVKR